MAKASRKRGGRRRPSTSGESVGGYFRRLYEGNPQYLRAPTNEDVLKRWLADHPGETEVPQRIRNILYNLKSKMLKEDGRKPARRGPGGRRATRSGRSPAAVRLVGKRLEGLEEQIDECLGLAKRLDREGLNGVIMLLRQARNEVVWKQER
jgi:hypothetical protein